VDLKGKLGRVENKFEDLINNTKEAYLSKMKYIANTIISIDLNKLILYYTDFYLI
jgi:hypothetical protein